MSSKKLTRSALIAALVATPLAHADAGVGAGISYVFGEGLSVGLKVFSSDRQDKAAASIGIDYLVAKQAWRPNVGVSYLGDNVYGDLSAGYTYKTGSWSFGIGAGGVDTKDNKNSSSASSGSSGSGSGTGSL